MTCSPNVRQRRFGSTPSRMIASRPAPGSGACRKVFSGQSIWRVEPVDERDHRPRRLEVVEALRVDRRELLGRPGLREVGAGERRALAAVVPAAERGDQHGALELRALVDAKLVRHRRILRGFGRTPEPHDERGHRRPDRRRERDVHEHEPPRQVRPVLGLADRHLHEQQAEHERRAAQVRAPVASEPDERAPRTTARRPPSRARASRRPARTTRGAARPCCPDAGRRRWRAVPLTISTAAGDPDEDARAA